MFIILPFVFSSFLCHKQNLVYNKILTRDPCSIECFIEEDNVNYTPKQVEFIKKVRFCIAYLAKVPEENIYPQDSFDTMIGYLPFWNSFDEGTFVILLTSKTGVVFSPESLQKVTNPDISVKDITVKDFILELLQATNL
jgi:hypothetical protein